MDNTSEAKELQDASIELLNYLLNKNIIDMQIFIYIIKYLYNNNKSNILNIYKQLLILLSDDIKISFDEFVNFSIQFLKNPNIFNIELIDYEIKFMDIYKKYQ